MFMPLICYIFFCFRSSQETNLLSCVFYCPAKFSCNANLCGMEKLQNPGSNCFRQQGNGENWDCHIPSCDCYFFQCNTRLLLSHWSKKWKLLHDQRLHFIVLCLCLNTIYLGFEKFNNYETLQEMDFVFSNLYSIKRHHYCYQGLCIDFKPLF